MTMKTITNKSKTPVGLHAVVDGVGVISITVPAGGEATVTPAFYEALSQNEVTQAHFANGGALYTQHDQPEKEETAKKEPVKEAKKSSKA